MATFNTASVPQLVSNEEIDMMFYGMMADIKQPVLNSGLYKVEQWPLHSGDTKEYSRIDLEKYASYKSEGAQANSTNPIQGYNKKATLRQFSMIYTASCEIYYRHKYGALEKFVGGLSGQLINRRELDLTHRITFGTATSYTDKDGNTIDTTVGDGLALFSTSHTLTGSATTYRNILANNPAFSQTNLESMETMVRDNGFNNFGELTNSLDFDILWSGDDALTVNAIREVLQSTAKVSATNEGVVNVYQSKYRHVELPLLGYDASGRTRTAATTKWWGLASSGGTSAHFAVERAPMLVDLTNSGKDSIDFSTLDHQWQTYHSYSICIVDGHWITLSKADGTA